VGFSKWTVLIGRMGFDTIPSIPDPTLSLNVPRVIRSLNVPRVRLKVVQRYGSTVAPLVGHAGVFASVQFIQ
jgi:hypothetical protein